ncbi:ankyrin repeat domain-containing protein [Candidatus Dependentiae bacterium]|nr:ankyrin repeat domain-containing protein [Candidatus Dependentiae bacterium]
MKNLMNKFIFLLILSASTNLISMRYIYDRSTKQWTKVSDQIKLLQEVQDLFKLEDKDPKSIFENFKKFKLLEKADKDGFAYANEIISGGFSRYQKFLLNNLTDEDFLKLNRYLFLILEQLTTKEITLETYDVNNLISLIELVIDLKKLIITLENNAGQDLLNLAWKANQIDLFKKLLEQKFNANKPINEKGDTLLTHFCKVGNIKIVKLLIKAGADFDKLNKENVSPITYAAYNKHKEIVEILIKAGSKRCLGIALINAAAVGDKEIVELLINAGAEIDEKAAGGHTAISEAIKYGYKDIADILRINGSGFKKEKKSKSCNIV